MHKKIISCLILIGVGCCVLLSGCETKKEAGHIEKLIIAASTTIHPVLIKIAEEKGFFREEGLDVTLQFHTTGISGLQSLISGKADLATAADTPLMFTMMRGAKLSILATIETSTKNVAIVARKDRGISSAADLKGRRIGVPFGTSGDYFLDSYLTLNGMNRKDVILVDMKPEKMAGALHQGKVDAVSVWNPLVTTLGKELGDRGVMLHNDSAYKETSNVVSMQGFAEQHPETIRRLLRALVRAEDFVLNNPQESQRIISKFCGIDIPTLMNIWNDFQFIVSLKQSLLLSLENQAHWAINNDLTDNHRTMPNFYDSIYTKGLKAVKPEAFNIITMEIK